MVKLKVKMGRRQITILVVVALAIFALVVSRSKEDEKAGVLDDAANRACSTFAAGYPRAKTKTARLGLADRVMVDSGRTDNAAISKRAAELGRNADADNATWKASAAALTGACREAGWKAP